jgi:hypothetical protein
VSSLTTSIHHQAGFTPELTERMRLFCRSLSVRVVTILQLVLRYCKLCRVVTTDHANEHTGSAAKFKQLAQDFHASHNFLLRVRLPLAMSCARTRRAVLACVLSSG